MMVFFQEEAAAAQSNIQWITAEKQTFAMQFTGRAELLLRMNPPTEEPSATRQASSVSWF